MDDNKKSTTIWLRPSVISRMDGWLEADNCQSRSEFVDRPILRAFHLKILCAINRHVCFLLFFVLGVACVNTMA